MAPLLQCPHCDSHLPPVEDAYCPDCGGELVPDAEEASVPPLRFAVVEMPPAPAKVPPAATSHPATPTPESAPPQPPSDAGSPFVSLLIAMILGASVELMSHKSAGAMLGTGTAILITLIGALVIHAIRVFLAGGDRNGTGFGLACLVLLIALFTHYDEKWFAARRPWNLFLATLFLAGGAVVLTGFVFALLRMFESKRERAMGKTCLGLGPAGLGVLLAMGWGWRVLYRENSPIPEDKKDRHFKLMCAWTAGLVVQFAVLGYVWYKAPAGRAIIPPVQEPPIAFQTEEASRNHQGVFYRVRLVNTSNQPINGMRWAKFPGEEWRVKEDKRRQAKWQLIDPIPPGGFYDLPNRYDAGWVFEFDAGEQGVKVYTVTGR